MNIGFRIFTDFTRPDPKMVDQFKQFSTANIADNMNRCFCLDSSIKKINSKPLKMVGTAFTIKTKVGDNLMVHKSLDLAKPGDIVVIDAEGDTQHAILGEIMVREAMACKLAGFLIDGAIRDSAELRELDFPVFARGATPRGPFKDGPGEINVPISCGGVVINPGDIIVGDDDGVVIVTPQYAQEISEKTQLKLDKEQKTIEGIIQKGSARDKSWADKVLAERGCEIMRGRDSVV